MKSKPSKLPIPEILVVDDDLYLLAAIKQTLVLNGYAAQTFANPLDALARIDEHIYSAVLADIRMPEMNGLALLERILTKDPDLPVILITGHGDIGLAVEAVKQGAYHFLQKPVDEGIILATLARAIERRRLVLENRHLARQLTATREGRSHFYGLVGSHPAMLALYTLIETIAHESDPVLIIGETGTGKELAARALHAIGRPEAAPYVAVNMGALPAEMIESELFGHEKGAFTGAIHRKIGKFEYAGTGTLFLDEICSMPAPLQTKLLRVLEERTFTRLGGNAAIPLKARVITATNRDLGAEIDRGAFRQDLYFRLNVLPVHLPPLRDRKEDIPLLVEAFWAEYCDDQHGEVRPCSPELIRRLIRQDWPGNVRELRNFVRRYCVFGGKEPMAAGSQSSMTSDADFPDVSWKEYMERQEQHYIEQMLRRAGGRVSAAHRAMGISRKSLYDKINKYKITLQQFREEEPGG
ncbi:MAG: sigma-54 dependent transcriptional regulator [Proteobacteria bacterium]|nr:sigma-54 dependent transcriptional regulator [Pseudomonadota bacterium]